MNHEQYMQLAFREARFAVGGSDPNPAVGALLVNSEGQIIGRGFTQAAGHPHAEIMAIREAQAMGHALAGSTLYVTLEPCCHWGRTPPCTDAIIHEGIKHVIIACRDFSAEVAQRSVGLLQKKGITTLVLSQDNFYPEIHFTLGNFSYRLRQKRPALVAKWAQTTDGYLAPESGPSGAITSPLAHALVQRLRRFFPVILTGPGTVVTDRPRLTRRSPYFKHSFQLADQNFLGELLARFDEEVPVAAYEGPYRRYFILPREASATELLLQMNAGSGENVRFFALKEKQGWLWNSLTGNGETTHVEVQPSYPELWNSITTTALQDGANAIFIETGPNLSDALLKEHRLDALYVFIAAVSSGRLWGKPGRSTPASLAIARQQYQALETYGLRLRCRLSFGDESLLYFARDDYWFCS